MEPVNLSYKEHHVNFISGHNGTSLYEIALIATTSSASLLLREILLLKLSYSISSKLRVRFCIDFIFLVMSTTCNLTSLADQVPIIFTLYVLTSFFLVMSNSNSVSVVFQSTKTFLSTCKRISDVQISGRLAFISNYRACVNLATAICILAVDFKVFPRRFCKSEVYGSGVMDVGVAAFVISNAIVAPEARGRLVVARSWSEVVRRVTRSSVGSLHLICLGIGRLISVKGYDYHEHVSEYGVHWNFFFTLAIVRIASTLVTCFVSHKKSWLVAIVIAVVHEIFLELGLKTYIIYGYDGKGGRDGFIDSNREGIFSCFGYLSIYFAGVQLGQFLLIPRQNFGSWMKAWWNLAFLDLFLWLVFYLSLGYLEPVSRRLTNLTYIIWMMIYSVKMFVQLLGVDLGIVACKELKLLPKVLPAEESGDPRTFHLLEAMNRNGLCYFLLANVFTGMINMNIATLETPPVLSLVIIFSYLFILSATISALHVCNISIKFW